MTSTAKQLPHSGTCADVEATLVDTIRKLRALEMEAGHLRDSASNEDRLLHENANLKAKLRKKRRDKAAWRSEGGFIL